MARTSRKEKREAKKSRRRTFRIIPLTVTMLALLFIIKVNELYIGSRQLREFYDVREASAEDKKDDAAATPDAPKDAAKPDDAAKPADVKADAKTDAASAGDAKPDDKSADGKDKASDGKDKKDKPIPGVNRTYGTGKSELTAIEALKAKESTPRFTQNEVDLLENLAKRRDELDQREKDLDVKSKVLDATEKRINDKLSEMKTLQVELTKVVAQYNEKQDTQIKSLVKIYENMKPGDAANIFNEMDMPILLEVIDKMSERKVAPVLAAMDPKKARDVTEELAAMRHQVAKAGGGN